MLRGLWDFALTLFGNLCISSNTIPIPLAVSIEENRILLLIPKLEISDTYWLIFFSFLILGNWKMLRVRFSGPVFLVSHCFLVLLTLAQTSSTDPSEGEFFSPLAFIT